LNANGGASNSPGGALNASGGAFSGSQVIGMVLQELAMETGRLQRSGGGFSDICAELLCVTPLPSRRRQVGLQVIQRFKGGSSEIQSRDL
jgi:hypothetical protein